LENVFVGHLASHIIKLIYTEKILRVAFSTFYRHAKRGDSHGKHSSGVMPCVSLRWGFDGKLLPRSKRHLAWKPLRTRMQPWSFRWTFITTFRHFLALSLWRHVLVLSGPLFSSRRLGIRDRFEHISPRVEVRRFRRHAVRGRRCCKTEPRILVVIRRSRECLWSCVGASQKRGQVVSRAVRIELLTRRLSISFTGFVFGQTRPEINACYSASILESDLLVDLGLITGLFLLSAIRQKVGHNRQKNSTLKIHRTV